MKPLPPSISPPDDSCVKKLVEAAQAAGADTVRIKFARKTKVSSSGVVKLYGGSGPASSEDHRVERVDVNNVIAVFRVADLCHYMSAKSRRCRAIGCDASRDAGHLMCSRHWKMVPGRNQVAVYMSCQGENGAAAQEAIACVAAREGTSVRPEADDKTTSSLQSL